ncbi:MAG TPA: hypothetical protein VIL69_06005 [Roseomonas sp.]|jgi:hypothetical protein
MRALPLLGLVLSLAGCGTEVHERPGTWQSTGVNDRNLAAMLENPADLHHGRVEAGERGAAAAPPIRRLNEGKRPALPAVRASTVGQGGGSPGGGDAPR